MKTRTLFDRYIARVRKAESIMHPNQHVRAELQRVARQVRKKFDNPKTFGRCNIFYEQALNDVLAMLKEAQR